MWSRLSCRLSRCSFANIYDFFLNPFPAMKRHPKARKAVNFHERPGPEAAAAAVPLAAPSAMAIAAGSTTPSSAMKRPNKRKAAVEPTADGVHSDSSGTHEWVQRTARRASKKKSTASSSEAKVPIPPPVPLPSSQLLVTSSSANLNLQPLSTVFKQYPYLYNDPSSGSSSASSSNPSQAFFQKNKEQLLRETEEAKVNPVALTILRDKLAKLPRPVLSREIFDAQGTDVDDPKHAEHIRQALVARRVVLPLLTVVHENFLLGQCGKFPCHKPIVSPGTSTVIGYNQRTYEFPACLNEQQCVATRFWYLIKDLQKPIILTAMMYPPELAAFLQTGQAPLERRQCILCYRYHFCDLVLYGRSLPRTVSVDPTCVLQIYRNLCDVDRGYLKQYMLMPMNDRYEGFIDGIVQFQPTLLAAKVPANQGGRIVIDQSALIYRPPKVVFKEPSEHAVAHIGESMQDFHRRSNRSTTQDRDTVEVVQALKLRALDPRNWLLRLAPGVCVAVRRDRGVTAPGVSSPSQPLTTIVQRCLQRFQSAQTYENAIALDSVLLPWFLDYDTLNTGNRTWAVLADVLCDLTIYDAQTELSKLCYWFSTKAIKNHVVHIFSKVLPQRCQTRKFSSMLTKFMSRQGDHKQFALDVFTCALLGNFRHSQHRASPYIRALVYYIRFKSPEQVEQLVLQFPDYMIWILRAYFVDKANSIPVLAAHMQRLFDWKVFETVVNDTVYQLCSKLLRRIQKRKLWASQQTDFNREGQARYPEQWVDFCARGGSALAPVVKGVDSHAILRSAHAKVLQISYQRGRNPLIDEFHVLVPKNPPPLLQYELSQVERDVIWQWVQRLKPTCFSVKTHIEPCFRALGCSPLAIKALEETREMYESQMTGKKLIKSRVHYFATKFPVTFAYFREFCAQWKLYSSITVYNLPEHITRNQIAVIKSRYGDSNVIPVNDAELVFCWCCRHIVSLVRAFNGVCRPKKQKPHTPRRECPDCFRLYKYGYKGAVLDYITGELFCERKHEPCEVSIPTIQTPAGDLSTKLTRVLLLGRIVKINHQLYTLCPQPSCGRPMVYDPALCEYNEYGFACARCSWPAERTQTVEAAEARSKKRARLASTAKPTALRRCHLCHADITNASNDAVFRYHESLYLCSKHHKDWLCKAVRKAARTQPLTLEEISKILLSKRDEYRQEQQARRKKADDYSRRVNKQRLRARKPG